MVFHKELAIPLPPGRLVGFLGCLNVFTEGGANQKPNVALLPVGSLGAFYGAPSVVVYLL